MSRHPLGNLNEGRDTHRPEGSHLTATIVRRDVVDGHATLTPEAEVDHLRHPLVASVLVAEVDVCGPVVGEVLTEGARRAGRLSRGVVLDWWHGCVECVSTHDLVQVTGLGHARVDERVETFDDELGALEPHHGRLRELARGLLREHGRRGRGDEGLHAGQLDCLKAGTWRWLQRHQWYEQQNQQRTHEGNQSLMRVG